MARRIPLVNGEIYHIFNRGVDKRTIFQDKDDVLRFIQSVNEFNTEKPIRSLYAHSFPLVNVICFCLNPNHFHLMVRQEKENGISEFMKRLGGGYTWYFNKKHKRSGSLFQGRFKSVHVGSNEQLLYLSVYVNLNYQAHQLSGPTAELVQSSYPTYVQDKKSAIVIDPAIVLDQFKSKESYKKYAEVTIAVVLENKELKRELECED